MENGASGIEMQKINNENKRQDELEEQPEHGVVAEQKNQQPANVEQVVKFYIKSMR